MQALVFAYCIICYVLINSLGFILYISTQINMKNPSDAKFLENHISFNDMRSFVCEDADDMDLFLSKIRDEQKLKINCVKSPSKQLSQFQPRIPLAHLQ